MARRDTSIAPALCVSLLAHGLGLAAMAWWYIEHTPAPKLAALDKLQVLVDSMDRARPTPPPNPPPNPPDKPAPPKEQPKLIVQKKPPIEYEKPRPEDHHDDSGEANGKGTANRSTDGKQPMQANANELEQADLMKDANKFSENALLPASKGALVGNNALPQKEPSKGAQAEKTTQSPTDPTAVAMAVDQTKPGIGPPPSPAVSASHLPTPKPMQKQIVGHRATVSDTESVPFAKADSVNFVAGKLEARQGVKVRTTEPRYGDASIHDYEIIGDQPTIFGTTVDRDGNVVDVQILQSSGSTNIDQDRKIAVWNWILEPKKDKDGHLIGTWVINFG
jgi:hypothetical protein